MTLNEVALRAVEQLSELTGYRPVAVVGSAREDGGWRITVDLLELNRIPPSSDLLGVYQALVDEEGNLMEFERKMTHNRGDILELNGA
jgi:hypothetical protein